MGLRTGMAKRENSQLIEFNTLALRFQDEAFTFAYYLLGDEVQASEATQAAFAGLYRSEEPQLAPFRLEVLRWVLAQCRRQVQQQSPVPRFRMGEALINDLQWLGMEERSAVVLVDVIGLPYDEAARVIGIPRQHLIRSLALGRLRMSHGAEEPRRGGAAAR